MQMPRRRCLEARQKKTSATNVMVHSIGGLTHMTLSLRNPKVILSAVNLMVAQIQECFFLPGVCASCGVAGVFRIHGGSALDLISDWCSDKGTTVTQEWINGSRWKFDGYFETLHSNVHVWENCSRLQSVFGHVLWNTLRGCMRVRTACWPVRSAESGIQDRLSRNFRF